MTERAKLAREVLQGLDAIEDRSCFACCVVCSHDPSDQTCGRIRMAAALTSCRALCALLESEAGQEGDAGEGWEIAGDEYEALRLAASSGVPFLHHQLRPAGRRVVRGLRDCHGGSITVWPAQPSPSSESGEP